MENFETLKITNNFYVETNLKELQAKKLLNELNPRSRIKSNNSSIEDTRRKFLPFLTAIKYCALKLMQIYFTLTCKQRNTHKSMFVITDVHES